MHSSCFPLSYQVLMSSAAHYTDAYFQAKPKFGLVFFGKDKALRWTPAPSLRWMEFYWYYTLYISVAYLITIFTLRRVMRDREAFSLRGALFCWNAALSIFSFIGGYYLLHEMHDALLSNHGSFYNSVCISSTWALGQYWIWLFALSKIFELGDTLFIVFRKQKLILLHWTHHISALVYTWYAYGQNISLGRWFVAMNYCVHTLMYAYYAIRALQYKIPRPIAMVITTLQIIQMMIGFYISYYTFNSKLTGQYCEIPTSTATFGFFVYLAFFLLFAKFFVETYFKKFVVWNRNRIEKASNISGKVMNNNGNCAQNGHAKVQ